MLTDSPSARAALLHYAGRLLHSQDFAAEYEAADSKSRSGVSYKISFLQSARFVEAAAKPTGLERPELVLATLTSSEPTIHFSGSVLDGASLYAPHRSGAPPLS